jgi:hypothetical protein
MGESQLTANDISLKTNKTKTAYVGFHDLKKGEHKILELTEKGK